MFQRALIIDAARALYTVRHTLVQAFGTPLRQGNADYGNLELASFHHRIKSREDHLVGQIAGNTEDNERVRTGSSHSGILFCGGGLLYMAAELVAHGGEHLVGEVGLAARAETIVQGGTDDRRRGRLIDGRHDRPAALPGIRDPAAELGQVGLSSSDAAVRSNSHEAITLPRRQTSAMSARFKSYW